MSFGVFYTCYTETKAVQYSLEKLFEFYPETPVYLVSDGGSDYSFLKDVFPDKNISVKLEEDSRADIAVIDRTQDHFSSPNKEIMIETIKTFLRRVNDAVEYCQKDYILIMEPDVLIRGKFDIPSNTKLMTNNSNNVITPLSKGLPKMFKNIPKAIVPKCYGMPIIFSTSHFKTIMEKFENDQTLIEKIYMKEPHFTYYDKMFSIIFALIGILSQRSDQITECFRDKDWRTNGKPIVHQYREFYPSKEEHKSKYSTSGHQALNNAFKNNLV